MNLAPEELAAIREAMSSGASTPSAESQPDAKPISLLADDRVAVRARFAGMKLGELWAKAITKRMKHMSLALEATLETTELIDGATWRAQRAELGVVWSRYVKLHERAGSAFVIVGGALIEVVAAGLLGGEPISSAVPRQPSPMSMSLFAPAGESVVSALLDALREEGLKAAPIDDPVAAVAEGISLADADSVVIITLQASGLGSGFMRVVARPDTLTPPPPSLAAVNLTPEVVATTLGDVPIVVCVEMGRLRTTLTEVAALQPGRVLTLGRSIDEALPVRFAGVVKAYGRAFESHGLLAVEVVRSVLTEGKLT